MTCKGTLILGIGNTLLTDEGAGIHALNHLQSAYPDIPDLTFLDGGTLSFTLATWIEDCTNLVVFDATELQQPAGSVNTFVGTAMDEFLGTTKRSAHEVGLLDLMDIARITGHLPENRALIGIQPEIMDWGMQPTAAVQNALDTAANEAVSLIREWQGVNTDQGSSAARHYRNKTGTALPETGA
jgi:hydrogenase maturation protease